MKNYISYIFFLIWNLPMIKMTKREVRIYQMALLQRSRILFKHSINFAGYINSKIVVYIFLWVHVHSVCWFTIKKMLEECWNRQPILAFSYISKFFDQIFISLRSNWNILLNLFLILREIDILCLKAKFDGPFPHPNAHRWLNQTNCINRKKPPKELKLRSSSDSWYNFGV